MVYGEESAVGRKRRQATYRQFLESGCKQAERNIKSIENYFWQVRI